MGGFDRSKYKPTPMAALKAQDQEHESKRPSNNTRGFLEIKPGDNKFRIYPCHPDGGGKTYSEAKCVTFLTVTTQSRDDKGKPIEGKSELKRRPIFNSKVHGNTAKDMVEVYLEVAKRIAIPAYTEDKAHQNAIWSALTNGMTGIKPSDSWVMYASKFEGGTWGPVGILEVKKSIKTQMQELALSFAGNDPVSPDPFTDPNDGIAVVINKSGEGLNTEYKVSLDSQKVNKFNTEYLPTPLTDEQLEAFGKLDPLHKLYVNVFKASDLELELEGLKNFEEELAKKGVKDKDGNHYPAVLGVFQYDEFQKEIDAVYNQLPQEADAATQEQQVEQQEEEQQEEPVAEEEVTTAPPPPPPAPKVVKKPAASPAPKAPAPAAPPKPAPAPAAGPVSDTKDRLAALRSRLGK